MSDTHMLERRVNSLFDENYEKARTLFRPTYEQRGFTLKIREDEIGSLIKYCDALVEPKNGAIRASVRFYDTLLKEFSELPEWIRKQMTLRVREPTTSLHSQPMLVSIGRTRDSDPDFARHSVALHIKAVFDKYDASVTRIEYEGSRRQEHKMPFMASLDTASHLQAETARMYHFMHLGLGQFYTPQPRQTLVEIPPAARVDPKATTVAYLPDA